MQQQTSYKYINIIPYRSLVNWSASFALGNTLDYKDGFKLVKIGNLIERNKTKIEIQNNVSYRRVTIRLYGKGVLQRDEVMGNTIGTKNQYVISSGQFIMSKIDARNGAFGIVPPELEGAIVTQDFLSYNINANLVLPEFFLLLTSTQKFLDLCQRASSGTTGRQRVDEKAFLNFEIAVPKIELQKSLIESYNKKTILAEQQENEANRMNVEIIDEINDFLGISNKRKSINKGLNIVRFKDINKWGVDFLFNAVERTNKFPIKTISKVCKISSGGTPSRSRKEYYSGNIPWIKTGELNDDIIFDTEEKISKVGLANSSAKLYPAGSIIVAMYGATIGKTAKLGVEATTNQACAVLFDFSDEVLPDFIWLYIQSQVNFLKASAYGSAQPNINAQIVGNLEIPIPPIMKQKELVQMIASKKNKIKRLFEESNNNQRNALEEFESSIFK